MSAWLTKVDVLIPALIHKGVITVDALMDLPFYLINIPVLKVIA